MTIRRTVKRVLDGDTFQTYRKVNGSNYVRLAGVNAPERHQFGGSILIISHELPQELGDFGVLVYGDLQKEKRFSTIF